MEPYTIDITSAHYVKLKYILLLSTMCLHDCDSLFNSIIVSVVLQIATFTSMTHYSYIYIFLTFR